MGNFRRDNRSGGRDFGQRDFRRRSFGDRGRDRQMHQTVCSDCGKDCEVPFVPTGDKPVFCSECFEKRNRGSDSRRFESGNRPQNNEQFEAISRKLDKILEMLTVTPLKEEKETKAKTEEITIVAKKKKKIPKKEAPDTKE